MDRLAFDRRTLLLGLAAMAAPLGARAATAADYKAMKAFIDSYVETRRLPGMVAAIKRRDDPVAYLSAGTLAFDTTARAQPDSLYRVYSMTKPITSMAAMKLIEDGKLRLDQPVHEILPAFRDQKVLVNAQTMETRPAAKPMTVRHLMTHTAGLSYHINNDPLGKLYVQKGVVPGLRSTLAEPGEIPPTDDLVEFGRRIAAMPLNFDPGSRWQYSAAHDVLGLVVQTVSGMSFYDYLNRTFFTPLGMRDTDFQVPANKVERLASVYSVRDGQPVVRDDRKDSPFSRGGRGVMSGGGGLISTAQDYIRFTTLLQKEGVYEGTRIFKPETVRLARSNLMEPGVLRGRNGFGAGMSVILPGGETAGREPAGAYNWFGIAGTQMWIDPVNDLSVVLMLQLNPTSYPVQSEVRVAAYQDLAAIRA